MPANAIKTKRDESLWAECKKSVKAAHSDYTGDKFYEAVMGCVKVRKENSGESFDEAVFAKIMEEEIPGRVLGDVSEVRRGCLVDPVGTTLSAELATPSEPKIYGMPKYEVENAVRVLEESVMLKNTKDARQKKIYEAALKVIADKQDIVI